MSRPPYGWRVVGAGKGVRPMGGVAHFLFGGRLACGVSDDPRKSATRDVRYIGCLRCIAAVKSKVGSRPLRGSRSQIRT